MQSQQWIGPAALVGAVAAIGLGIAALVLALDDDDPNLPPVPRIAAGVEFEGAGAGSGPGAIPDLIRGALAGSDEAWLGIRAVDRDEGLSVGRVEPGSPADRAGLEAGDVIREFAGDDVENSAELAEAIGEREPRDEVEIVLERDGSSERVEAELSARPSPFTGRRSAGAPPGIGGLAELLPGIADFGLERLTERLISAEVRVAGEEGEAVTLRAVSRDVVEISDEAITIEQDGDKVRFAIGEETSIVATGGEVEAGERVIVVSEEGTARFVAEVGAGFSRGRR